MTVTAVECLIRLTHGDFIMANHRVHGVSVMPGVTFLDVVYRVLIAQGIDHRRAALRDVLFAEPVTTRDGLERELRISIAAGDKVRLVRVDSRWLRDGVPCAPWRENARAELVFADEPLPPLLDVAGLKASALRRGDVDELYARARREGIRHGPAMTCVGRLYRGEPYLLAELRLDPTAVDREDDFHLHPGKMDASTLVAFGQEEGVGAEPFIPFHIGYFRAPHRLGSSFHVHVARPEVLAASGDLLTNDYTLHDEAGNCLAEVRRMACKRIRHPELITRLLAEVDADPPGPRGGPSAADQPAATSAERAVARHIQRMVADALGKDPADVPTNAGFYDLGLDSVALLRMGEQLEALVGATLYPTLLFEFGDVDSLARHLAATYPIRAEVLAAPMEAPSQAPATTGPAVGPAAARCLREVWVAAPTAAAAGHDDRLVVFGAEPDLLAGLRSRAHRVVAVEAGSAFARLGPGAFRLDQRDRKQVGTLLDALASDGASPTAYVQVVPGGADPAAATDRALALWALAGALVDRRPTRRTPILLVAPAPADPCAAGLAAMAATITAEVPRLACRLVEVDAWAGAPVADALVRELHDDSRERAVRYQGGVRQVRRWAPATPGPASQDSAPFKDGGVYLIAGAGGIAGLLADHLVDRYHARLVLVGRRAEDEALRRRMERWRRRGGEARYVRADVSRAEEVQVAVAQAREAFGRVDGVLHCAGALRDGLFFQKEAADLVVVCDAKVAGTVHLDAATAGDDLDFFVLFASLAGVLPNVGQADYAFANGFQLGFAGWRGGRPDRRGRTLAVAWPLWAEGGMRMPEEAVRRSATATGMEPMPTDVGLDLLARGLAGPHDGFAVLYGDPARVGQALPAAPAPAPRYRSADTGPADPPMPVAIIGMAGRYPGAADLEEFWRNLAEGRDCIVEVPPQRWDHAAYFDPDRDAKGRTYARWGGFLDGMDRFDPAFFGISRRDAERMDPQERLFLTASWQAFEDAGYPPRSLRGQPVGVFVGVMWNHYQLLTDGDDGVAPTAMHAAIANRVSYCLDLRGPSLAVDTACSSSLTAVHLAVESIRRGESALALAGGVNVTVHPQKYLQLAQGQFLSDDGRCRSFGRDGTGYVPGEGVGAVLLKPLDRALADGDHIYGVVAATAVNHTGRTSGFTVPSPTAQGELVRAALDQAGWDPATIGYVETHGTGTALGDPIEVEGLRRAFAGAELPQGHCAIGSVKSNIGHLESAAGIAGLTKVLLQLRHGQLVPSLHSAELNPQIDFAGSPFRVQQAREEWRAPPGGARRAGVSAFGAGGANAHVLVEEAPPVGMRPADPASAWLFVLSARTDEALRAYARRYADLLAGAEAEPAAQPWLVAAVAAILGVSPAAVDPAEQLGDLGLDASGLRSLGRRLRERWPDADQPTLESTVADLARELPPLGGADADPHFLTDLTYTLQVGRTPMAKRLAVVAASLDELRGAIGRFLDDAAPGGNGFWGPGPHQPPAELDAVDAFRSGRLAEVAAFWVAGGDVDWAACHAGDRVGRRRPLPGHPLQEERCWIGRWRRSSAAPQPAAALAARTPAPAALPAAAGAPGGEVVRLRMLEPGIALVEMRDGVFSPTLVGGLESAFARIAASDDARVVVVTGTDRVFNMGATPEALETLASGGSRFTDAPFVYEGMLRCDRPVIAAVRGHASGGGLAFALYADIVVLSREGVYSANFVKYGLTPGMGATYVLEQRLGPALAAEMFYTGRPFCGEELERRGAQVSFAPDAEVLPVALALARSVAESPPGAVRLLKGDLAGRTLDRLRPVIARESAMHERVFGAESVDHIRARFAKLDGFRSGSPGVDEPIETAAPVPPAAGEPRGAGSVADRDRVSDVVHEALGASLHLDRAEIDPGLAFSEMGLDSIGAVELVRELNRAFGLDLDSVAVYDHPTVPRLVGFVRDRIARDRALHAEALRPADAAPTAPAPPTETIQVPLPPLAGGADPAPAPAALPGAARVSLRPITDEPAPRLPTPAAGDIAVIGMAGRFPDAPDLDAFWANLAAGRDSVREVPADRWDAATFFDPDRRAPGRTYSKWAALLTEVAAFDPQFFRLSPLEATAMDPQQRLFLQAAWESLEDAGYALSSAGKRRWGVFVGCAAGDYLDLLRREGQDESAHAFLGTAGSVLAARIAYLLDLTGPTMAVDTACSSSLVAVHLACESIRAGECEAAIAGGVALMLTPRMHILTSKAGMLSPSGRCAPFDAAADGIVLGEGCGAVVLKRLDRALADRDQVHGVILASGVNGDGRTNGITAPSALSQAELIARVQQRAGVSPEDLTYVEAHGTGTPLGDPIEVKALDQVLGRSVGGVGSCGIGSVKSNIGHTTMAAGIAGLLKVLLALRHRTLPPSINFTAANPEIDFGRSRLRPITELEPWRPGRSGRLVGAVSSFGFSGTNAHLVVAEAPAPTDQPAPPVGGADAGPWLVPVSARDAPALVRTLTRLADRLADEAGRPALLDVAYTLALGRAHFPARAAFVVADQAELLARLRAEAELRRTRSADDPAPAPAAPGAGDELTDSGPDRRATLERLAQVYVAGGEVDWAGLYRDSGGRRAGLPAYPFANEQLWVGPAAPAPDPPDAGAARCPDTQPDAAGPDERVVDPADWLVADHLVGGRPVLPGVAALELAADAARAEGLPEPIRISAVQWLRPFEVTAARPLRLTMTPERDGRRFELSGSPADACCVRARISGLSADGAGEVVDVAAVSARCQQRRTGDHIYTAFAEAGIGYGPAFRVLEQVQYGDDEALGSLTVPAARAGEIPGRPLHPVPLDGALQTVAVLAGATVARPLVPFALRSVDVLGPVPEAGYSHVVRDGSSFTVRLADRDGRVRVRLNGLALRPLGGAAPAGLLFVPRWREAPALVGAPAARPRRILVVHGPDTDRVANALVAAHQAEGEPARAAPWPGPADREWPGAGTAPDVVYFLACGRDASQAPDRDPALLALFRTAKALLAADPIRRPRTLKVALAGAVAVGDGAVLPRAAGLPGMVGAIAAEYPHWTAGCVDVGNGTWDAHELAELLRREPCADRLVAVRGGRRMVRVLEPARLAPQTGGADASPFRPGGHYLVLGGAGGIGQVLCRYLAETQRARLTIVGRRPSDAAIGGLLADLERLGGRAIYLSADATDPAALRRAVRRARRTFGALHGAFHAALVLRDCTLARMDEAMLAEVLAPKVAGAVAFGEALRTERLDFMTFFSSAASFTDAAGQANYAAASTFEDAYAMELRRRCRFPVSVVNWGYWGGVGAVADARYAERMAGFGVQPIAPAEGMVALAALLRAGVPQALVIKASPQGLARVGVASAVADDAPAGRSSVGAPPGTSRAGGCPAAESRAAFAALDRLAPELLERRLRALGALPAPAGSTTVADLENRLGVVPARQRLFTALMDMLEAAGRIRRRDGRIEPGEAAATPRPTPDAVRARHPDLAPHVRLLERCVDALPAVLDGSRSGADVLFPGGSTELVEPVYRGQASADFYHRLMADQVRDALPRLQRSDGGAMRILEVGAGTGASSSFVLPACAEAGLPVEYAYTDVSSAFLRHGGDAFAARFPFVGFHALDIERDPVAQGFDEHGYDLVLATNVLHATSVLGQTLGHVRRLLRPGGLLLLNEVTRASDFLTLTFGLTPGWWRYQDPAIRLPNAPLLGPPQWRRALAEAGFGPVRTLGFGGTAADDLEQCLFVAVADQAGLTADAAAAGPSEAAVRGYVRTVFAEVLRFRERDLDDRVTFENYGVDSLVSLNILSRFERDLGPLPATLLFEHMTIADLARHLAGAYREPLRALLAAATPASSVDAAPDAPRALAAPATAGAAGPSDDDVAVVGVTGRYPGAPDLGAFWRMLVEGRSGVTEVPAERWDWRTHFDPEKGKAQSTYGRWGGFLEGVDQFDPAFFGILPRDAENIDPQERLFLETAWNLLEEAGYLGEHTREPETGVFVGTMYGSYGQLAAAGWAQGRLAGAHSAYWSIANRVSYFLDLHGPSFAVDSACSSSLLAVHLACESIRRGECRMAIAGGVNLILHPAHLVALSSLNMLSADGRCKVFDARADGFVPGEGVGAVLLKPLRQAIADRDRIWGVIKAGFANAGGKTGGYTVPNPNAQADLIAEAIRRAGVDPATISYVEAHGTGTALGDPIEVAALSRALGAGAPDGVGCALGSVKANVGHLEGAAGIAGLTKVLLQMRHGQLAPCANLDQVNGKIDLDAARCYLPRVPAPWPRPAGRDQRPIPRRAGVSSFGAGGANVHLVLEEYQEEPGPPAEATPDQEQLFVLSARTRDQLARFADRVAEFLRGPAGSGVRLDELCYTSQVRRRELVERLAVPAGDTTELAGRLAAFAGGRVPAGVLAGTASGTGAEPPPPGCPLAELAARWVQGARVDWRALWPAPAPRRVAFPTYPFERRRYWLAAPDRPTPASPAPAEERGQPGTVCRFHRPVWEPGAGAPASWRPRVLLVVTGEPALGEAFRALTGPATRCLVAAPGPRFAAIGDAEYELDPTADDQCAQLVESLADRDLLPDAVVQALIPADADDPARLTEELELGLYAFLRLSTAILGRRPRSALRTIFAHCSRADEPAPQDAAVAAAIRTLALEHTAFSGARVQFVGGPAPPAAAERAARLLDELAAGAQGDVEVRYRDGRRWAKRLEEFVLPAADGPIVRPGGTYLVTGGAGALGLHVAERLAADGPISLVLAGRSEPGPAAAERIAALARFGGSATFLRADVAREEDVRRLIAACGGLRGIVHAAGVTRDSRALRKTRAEVAAVLAPKVFGTVLLDEATRDLELDFFALFSSVVAETGNLGQVDYAAANAFLNAFAEQREARRRRGERSGRTVAIGWPLWAEGGMTVDEATRQLFARKWSMVPMRTEAGLDVLRRGLAGGSGAFLVVECPTHPRPPTAAPAPPSVPAQPAPERLGALAEDWLRGVASGFLLVDAAEVDLTDDLLEIGFDSISLTELIGRVNDTFRLDLLPTVLFECATLKLFAEYLVRHHGAELAAVLSHQLAVEPCAPIREEGAACADAAGAVEATRAMVAVVGIAGTLPGSPNLDAFWRHLVAGHDLVGPAPPDRLELHAHPDTAGVRGGFVEDVAAFDPGFFRISPAEAALMDPQQRLFLEAAWRAIENSGHRPDELAGTDTGLFVGVSTIDYADLLRQHGVPVEAHTASGIAHSILANRVSHILDLRGPSEAVDTACSSSLVAIHRAVQAIAAGECSAAIAGGVNALLSPGLFTAFGKSGMLSASGACRAFDQDADGYVRGEGAGAVLLKPLSAAEADRDHVYAVIRGTAVNHGGRSASLTAPSPEAQAQVVLRAYRAAGVDPTTVTAIEAHGTGTRLGDPVEVEGLKKAFATLYAERDLPPPGQSSIALGSVKANIGHLEAAAGIAGVLKTLLAMHHGVLPPSIHFAEPNQYLRLDGTPFFVNDRARPWQPVPDEAGLPVRRAGVSSFGFGGTNAHVVLEARAAPPSPAGAAGPQLLVLSARDDAALRRYAGDLADALSDQPELDLAGVAYTLQTGRTPLARRLTVVAADHREAVAALRAAAPGSAPECPMPDPADPPSAARRAELEALAGRWLAGADLPWEEWWRGRDVGRVPLPGVPLSRKAYWFDRRDERPRTEPSPLGADGRRREAPARRGPRVRLSPAAAGAAPNGARPIETGSTAPAPTAAPRPEWPAGASARPPDRPPADGTRRPSLGQPGAAVREQVAEVLGLAPHDVPTDRAFADLGLDSIFRMELARRLNGAFSIELQAAELYQHDTVEQLAAHVAGLLRGRSRSVVPVEPPGTPAARIACVGDGPGPSRASTQELLGQLVERVVGRPLDAERTFVDNGLTSFDMLRVVSALEHRFGALRKTLLFDQPTLAALAEHLTKTHGERAALELLEAGLADGSMAPSGALRVAPAAAPVAAEPPASGGSAAAQPLIVRKRELADHPDVAALVAEVDRRHAKEGGLAGRHIAPLLFVGSTGRAYFNFGRRGPDLFAWSYAGSDDDFPGLVVEWLAYAARHRLRASFLSLLPLAEAGGVPLAATPFGAVQRLEDLAGFTLDGNRMSRLRYMVRRFERAGACETVEYRPGDDAATDGEIAEMIGRWGEQKQMVNPYVGIVRRELRRGALDARHRVFLTRVDGELANVVIITKIPSEPGYLLDLEFYPASMPLGGLEYAIVSILGRLRDEGCALFSFGASFGVKVCDSPTAAPDVEQGLAELRSVGLFGQGNFQFKSKFRPTDRPIYLCQRADEEHTSVADVVLMIANPDVDADAPELLAGGLHPPPPAPAVAEPAAAPGTRARQLAACGYNPLALRHADVEVDLVTDSWAELDGPAIAARTQFLQERARREPDPDRFPVPDWMPFDHAVSTASGRAAEALLTRCWPGPRGVVVHNRLFPTWALSLADAGFSAVCSPGAADRRPRPLELFQGDLDLGQLACRLAEANGGTAFVCVELSGNAGGGYPTSVANLRAVREAAARHGVPLVLDATRVLENAAFVRDHEEGWRGRSVWDVARELLGLADAATLSLSKDFGVPFGGLVAARHPALVDRLREHEALRGWEIGLVARKVLACALADRDAVAAQVEARMASVRALWRVLADAGVPVVEPAGGHCVLLDVDRMPRFAGLRQPVESCLAWIYQGTGVRAAPHLGDRGADAPAGRHVRLAVPVGLPVEEATRVAERLARLWRDPRPAPDLLPVGEARTAIHARYHPAAGLPEDVEAAMREGHRPGDDNVAVLREHAPAVERVVIRRPGGQVEVFAAGDGPVLLLMHPFNVGVGVFARQFAALADRYRLVCVHHPGVGATTLADDLTLAGIAGLCRSVLAELGATGPCNVLGSSFGGLVAQSFALGYPADCASLVLVGSSYKVGNRKGEVNRLATVAGADFDRVVAHDDSARLSRERGILEGLLVRCESMDPKIGLSYLDVFAAEPTLFARLPELVVPTLVVHGRHDTVVPSKAAHLLHGAIPDARYEEIAGAGHFPYLTHADELHELIVPFLAGHQDRGVRAEPPAAGGPA